MGEIGETLRAVVAAQPEPAREVVLGAALLALAVVLTTGVWRVARNAVTIAHEGGHALAAVLAGRRLAGIRLHSDTSGVTLSHGRPSGPGMLATLAAGYVAPSLLGAGYAVLLAADRISAALWLGVVLLAGMLVLIRNAYGVLSVLVTGGVLFAVPWFAPPDVQAAFAYLVAWFLLLGGVRPVLELQQLRHRHLAPHSDADQLARLTGVPGLVWVTVFLGVTLALLIGGGYLLVG